VANEKKSGTATEEKKKAGKAGGELSLFLDMFGPNIKTWIKRGVWVAVGLLVALLIVQQSRASRARKVAEGQAQLAAAVTVEDFTRVATDNEGTPLAFQAQLSAAQKLFEDAKYTEAQERFARCASSEDALVQLQAALGQAHAVEAKASLGEAVDRGQLEAAQQLFKDAAIKAATHDLITSQVDALLGQSRCARLLGDTGKAREFIEAAKKVTDSTKQPALAYYAQTRVDGATRAIDAHETASPAPVEEAGPAEKPAAKPAEKPAEKPAATKAGE
jgi:hypothetical protein